MVRAVWLASHVHVSREWPEGEPGLDDTDRMDRPDLATDNPSADSAMGTSSLNPGNRPLLNGINPPKTVASQCGVWT
jgi:hypothetical protein